MRLFSPCLFGHFDRYRERLDDGTYALVCSKCGDHLPVNTSKVLTGPAHHQRSDLGRVRTKAQREPAPNVTKFRERQSQR
jgi:hypothetical protein